MSSRINRIKLSTFEPFKHQLCKYLQKSLPIRILASCYCCFYEDGIPYLGNRNNKSIYINLWFRQQRLTTGKANRLTRAPLVDWSGENK